MAELKRKVLQLSSGKTIKLYGSSIAINRSLELGEGYAPNLLSLSEMLQEEKAAVETGKFSPDSKSATEDSGKDGQQDKGAKRRTPRKITRTVSNPHRFTNDEILEIADYNIRLWMDLKDSVRKYGVNNPDVFNREM